MIVQDEFTPLEQSRGSPGFPLILVTRPTFLQTLCIGTATDGSIPIAIKIDRYL